MRLSTGRTRPCLPFLVQVRCACAGAGAGAGKMDLALDEAYEHKAAHYVTMILNHLNVKLQPSPQIDEVAVAAINDKYHCKKRSRAKRIRDSLFYLQGGGLPLAPPTC